MSVPPSPTDANWFRDAQLAKAAAQDLLLILAGAADERLHDIQVLRVDVQSGGRLFRVYFGPPVGADPASPETLRPRAAKDLLQKAKAYIRGELAEALNLKKAPDVSFVPDLTKWSAAPPEASEG
jgi:ribosome-binding factor A